MVEVSFSIISFTQDYWVNDPEERTWMVGNQKCKLTGHTLSNMACCKIPHKKRNGLKVPPAIHGILSPIFHLIARTNIIADCLENHTTWLAWSWNHFDKLCDCDHKLQVARGEAQLVAISEDVHVNFQPSNVSKEIQSLKLKNARGFDVIPDECLWQLSRRPLVHLITVSG